MTKYSLVFLLIASIFVCSCKKTVLTGSDLLPKGDNIGGTYVDTLTLLTKTTFENRLFTNNSSYYVLGSMLDPVFGKSYAGIFTQLAPQETNPSFAGCTLDSVVLCLVYAGKYGDMKTIPQSVNVYELTGTMSSDSSYYSDRTFAFNPTKIGGRQNLIPDFLSTPTENGDTLPLPPMLRIKLNNSFGQAILNADSINFTTIENFQTYLPGIFISPDTTRPGKGAMYINLNDPSNNSRLSLYYHTGTASNQQFNFLMSGGCGKSNLFKHNYTNSIAGAARASKATSDSLIYVQAMAGLRTRINIPFLPSNILVNKAEISITQVLDPLTDDTAFHVPNQMFVLADSAEIDQLTPDLLVSAPLSYGGLKTSFVNSKGQTLVTYKFSVTDVVQQVVTKLKTYPRQKSYDGLFLITGNSADLADRIVVGGGNSKTAKMKLTLVYTKLP